MVARIFKKCIKKLSIAYELTYAHSISPYHLFHADNGFTLESIKKNFRKFMAGFLPLKPKLTAAEQFEVISVYSSSDCLSNRKSGAIRKWFGSYNLLPE